MLCGLFWSFGREGVTDSHWFALQVGWGFPNEDSYTTTTIRRLRQLFLQYGIPKVVVSNNSTQFSAQEFEELCCSNGIHPVPVAPYHPSSNGLAEKAVQVVKQEIKKLTSGTLQDRTSRFLFQYRMTPHSTTRVSPAEMLLGRRIRSHHDILWLNLERRMADKQRRQKENFDKHAKIHSIAPDNKVYFHNHRPGPKWLERFLQQVTGPVSLYNLTSQWSSWVLPTRSD